jgi:hypothetical protein
LSDAHNENLVLVDVAFNLWYVWECPTDVVDIAGLPFPFNKLPPAFTDLEKEQPIPDPANTTPPTISGKNNVGELFTVNDGTWVGTNPITYTYQWKRNGTNIIGETNSTYTTVLADSGQTITCLVTATNILGSTNAISNSALIL